MKTDNLITALRSDIQQIIEKVEIEILPLDRTALNWKPLPGKWSILECLEHLCRYNRFYNAELENALGRPGSPSAFGPGWLGNYFVRTVAPGNSQPMKTMKYLNPAGSTLETHLIQEFLEHQQHLLQLLGQARGANLNRRRVRVEFFRLLRMKTGDAFRFVVAHQQRHLQQALRVAEMHTESQLAPKEK